MDGMRMKKSGLLQEKSSGFDRRTRIERELNIVYTIILIKKRDG